MEHKLCYTNCSFLSLIEDEQHNNREHHTCLLFNNVRLLHMHNHPDLIRCKECADAFDFGNKPGSPMDKNAIVWALRNQLQLIMELRKEIRSLKLRTSRDRHFDRIKQDPGG